MLVFLHLVLLGNPVEVLVLVVTQLQDPDFTSYRRDVVAQLGRFLTILEKFSRMYADWVCFPPTFSIC